MHEFLDPARFNVRLSLERETTTPDGIGGFDIDWVHDSDVWARLIPVAGILVSKAGAVHTEITHRIFLRRHSAVASGMRFVAGARRFRIETVRSADEAGKFLVCEAIEQAEQAEAALS